jgi:hypothetical protein
MILGDAQGFVELSGSLRWAKECGYKDKDEGNSRNRFLCSEMLEESFDAHEVEARLGLRSDLAVGAFHGWEMFGRARKINGNQKNQQEEKNEDGNLRV